MAASALDHHLATCPDCAGWLEDATRLTRQARLGTATVPDLAETILADAVLPVRKVLRRRAVLRWMLAVVGVVQLIIAAPSLFGNSIGMAMAVHASHESAAWNCALGIAMIATALRRRRAAGVFTVLLTFVGVLALLSLRDVASGAVAPARLATHLAAVAGVGLVALLGRTERALPPSRTTQDEKRGSGSTGLRGVA